MKKLFFITLVLIAAIVGCDSVNDDSSHDFIDVKNPEVKTRAIDLYGSLKPYFGNLHSHTKYSDGKGTPAEAYQWARDVMGVDFYAVTDHAINLSRREWNDTKAQAANYNVDGQFIAIHGFEWSHPFRGHICVWETHSFQDIWDEWSLGHFYDWIRDNGAVGQMNHPGRDWPGTFKDFNIYEWNHVPHMVTLETGNKNDGNYDNEFEYYYKRALDKGWKVGAVYSWDNHSLSYNAGRTVIVASALTKAELGNALVARRVYSSDDPNMKVAFKYGSNWMGSTVNTSAGNKTFSIFVDDDETITKIEIISNGGRVVASANFNSQDVLWEPTINVTSSSYYYVKIWEQNTKDGGDPYNVTITAPIWFNL